MTAPRSDIAQMQYHAIRKSREWFPTLHARPPVDVLAYMGLGVAGEAGEVADDIKKLVRCSLRTGATTIEELAQDEEAARLRAHLAEELGDVLAYLFNVAELLQVSLGHAWAEKMERNENRTWAGGNA